MAKTNPRKIQRTEEDCRRAETRGIDMGVRQCLKMVLYILLDKHDAPADDVQQLSEEVGWLAAMIANGKLSWSFVDKVLKENHVTVVLK